MYGYCAFYIVANKSETDKNTHFGTFSTAAKTISTYDKGNIQIRLRFNLALSKVIVRFICLALHELSHALSPKSGHDVKKIIQILDVYFQLPITKFPNLLQNKVLFLIITAGLI